MTWNIFGIIYLIGLILSLVAVRHERSDTDKNAILFFGILPFFNMLIPIIIAIPIIFHFIANKNIVQSFISYIKYGKKPKTKNKFCNLDDDTL